MKKILSVMVAVMMAVSMMAVSSVAFADNASPKATTVPPTTQTTAAPTTTTTKQAVNKDSVKTDVNNEESDEIDVSQDSTNPSILTFTYTGDGTITGWEDNLASLGFVNGVDFTAIENADGSYTITLLTDAAITAYNNGQVVVNALVEYDDQEEGEEEEETTKAKKKTTTKATTTTVATTVTTTTKAAKKNTSSKSPKTGASIATASIALAGASFAVLVALKKKED